MASLCTYFNKQRLSKNLCLLILMMGLSSSIENKPSSPAKLPVYPPLLKRGDKVAIVAPAFWVTDMKNVVSSATKILQTWGLEVVLGRHIYARHYKFAGTDAQRMEDLQWALDDPTVKAVFALRGGYGTSRIIDKLDFSHFLSSPKWVIGFSDITTLLIRLHQLGTVSVHGEMPKNFLKPQYASSIESLRALLFKGTVQLSAQPHVLNRLGTTTAPVVGGSLTMICNSLGTLSMLDTNKKILVLEDIGEQLYSLDRLLVQLKRAGMLQHLAGLVVGGMTDMQDDANNRFGKSAEEIIKEHVDAYDYPVAFNFPIGHEAPNWAFPHGGVGQLCVEKNKVSLTF